MSKKWNETKKRIQEIQKRTEWDLTGQDEESEFEDVDIQIKYVGAPEYLISVKAPDYKIAEEQMKKAVEKTTEYINSWDGECKFNREIEE